MFVLSEVHRIPAIRHVDVGCGVAACNRGNIMNLRTKGRWIAIWRKRSPWTRHGSCCSISALIRIPASGLRGEEVVTVAFFHNSRRFTIGVLEQPALEGLYSGVTCIH